MSSIEIPEDLDLSNLTDKRNIFNHGQILKLNVK